MNFKKIMATLLAGVMAVGMSAAAITLDTAETAAETAIAEAVLATEVATAMPEAVNGVITLTSDVVLDAPYYVAEGTKLTIDLNGYKLSAKDEANKYAIDNCGNLTLKDSVGTGSVNARGIYNGYNGGNTVSSAVLTVENGTYNAKGTNGGAAVYNYGTVTIKGGTFTSIGGYTLNSQSGASMTIDANITANNGIYVSGATLVVNGGEISGNRSGCHVVYAWNSDVTINGGTFYNYNSGNATIMAAGTTEMTINGGTFGIQDGRVPGNGNTWTSCLTDTANTAKMTVNGGTFNGGFRVQGNSNMVIFGGSYNDVGGSGYNIYGTATVLGGTFTDAAAKKFASDKAYNKDDFDAENGTFASTYVAEVNGVYYTDIVTAFKAVTATNNVVNFLADVTYTEKWDRRYTGATFAVPVTINGNGHTFKLTGEINEGQNYHALFRTENVATFNDLTIDLSEATSVNSTRMRAISAKTDIIINNCTIKGNPAYTNSRAVSVGEGAGSAVSEIDVVVLNSNFDNWTVALRDNENGQDLKTVTVADSAFTNAGINVGASEKIVITNNTFEDSIITVTSYTKDETEVDVTVNNNTLDIDSKINVRFDVAEEIAVTFKNPVKTEETATYDIVLVANDAETINRLNSVDLAFVLDNYDMIYEILATNEEVVINPVEENRYEFHYNGKTGVTTDTAKEIKIGSVKFSGYGEFTFKVDTSFGTNVAHATKLVDNIVDTFVPGGSAEYGDLILNDEALGGIIDDEIVVPTRALEINVTFPNEVKEVYAANQKMTVTVSGGDLADAIVYNLGTDVAMNNGSYTMTTALTKSITYNVTVSGAGYRTARYTVTMNQDENETKTLNFWNNVKDNKVEVEEGKASSATEKNFLAGDIVADNQINIYDLSAVVSYFATSTSANYEKYTKYDLNRDGTIDSKDVAYILVSWME